MYDDILVCCFSWNLLFSVCDAVCFCCCFSTVFVSSSFSRYLTKTSNSRSIDFVTFRISSQQKAVCWIFRLSSSLIGCFIFHFYFIFLHYFFFFFICTIVHMCMYCQYHRIKIEIYININKVCIQYNIHIE